MNTHEVVYVTVTQGTPYERIFEGSREECIAHCDDQNADDGQFGLGHSWLDHSAPIAPTARCRVRDLATGEFEPEFVVKVAGVVVAYGTNRGCVEFARMLFSNAIELDYTIGAVTIVEG